MAAEPDQGRQRRRDRSGQAAGRASFGHLIARLRDLLATAVFTVAVLAALVLALGALLTALGANEGNALVSGVLTLAGRFDGPFADIFTFDSVVKQTLVNWGIAAAVYLVVGRILERLIRP
ncbi:hypothetical protein [Actinopolymorpha alba]|uniref:hypothetical protein n=1 Tax=Actinopolymorpha alba TaxID=533267 RepID=UPI000380107E|nr:hypothetical protein [Actinopolymorpha alba]